MAPRSMKWLSAPQMALLAAAFVAFVAAGYLAGR
jgi:hypothetical protein